MANKEFSGGAYASSGGGQVPHPVYKPPAKTSSTLTISGNPLSKERYAKPKPMAGLPGWAKEIRAGSNFMPSKIKPISYNYMALVESPNRAVAYSAPTQSQTTIGGAYFKPTDKVAQGVKQEHNLWQDIKNIGGNIIHKSGSLLGGVLDVISRPLYTLMNTVKTDLERDYGQDGDVTGWEALLGITKNLTPVGVVQDMLTGQMDDRLKAGWAGMSGKEKTRTEDILKLTNPEFVKEHPKWSTGLSIGGDIIFDPVTWLTMGANPGSVARGIGAGSKFLIGDKAAAARLWDETLFTSTGRASGARAVKLDAITKERNRLGRVERRAQGKLDKIAANKKTRLSEQHYNLRKQGATQKLTEVTMAKLKGADLAKLIIKKGAPTLGLNTVSRFNTGAGASAAFRGAAVFNNLTEEFHLNVANDMESDDGWKMFYAANKGQDIQYENDGVKHTVKLSEAKNFKDFLYKIVAEAAPVAKYAEHGTEAARTRGERIIAVDTRGKAFQDVLSKHMQDTFDVGFGKDFAKESDKLRSIRTAVGTATDPTDEDLAKLGILKMDQETLQNMSHSELQNKAKAEWDKANPGGEKWTDKNRFIILKGADDKYRKVSISALGKHARDFAKARKTRVQERELLSMRSKEQVAFDRLTGHSDEVLGARLRYATYAKRLREARQADSEAAWAERAAAKTDVDVKQQAYKESIGEVGKAVDPESKIGSNILNEMREIITESGSFSDEEIVKYMTILKDESIPMDQRIAKIFQDKHLSNEEVNEILKDIFKVDIDDAGVIHVSKGGDYSMIPEIIKTVIRDRFKHRLNTAQLKTAGVSLQDDPEGGIFRVVHDFNTRQKDSARHLRDVNGEIGMMTMDAMRAALEYAAKNDLWKDPEALIYTINESMAEFINHASADVKQQVFGLMYNLTGTRLPENFVPLVEEVDKLIGQKGFRFTTKTIDPKTGKPKEIANQNLAWQDLGQLMQGWVRETFKFLPSANKRLNTGTKTGYDMDSIGAEVERLSTARVREQAGLSDASKAKLNEINETVDQVNQLALSVRKAQLNGRVDAVNRYSFLDFILHDSAIIKAQKTTVHVANTTEGKIGRVNSGRLSALDSFTFVDKGNQDNILALTKLKNLTKSDDAETALMAQQALADLFVKNGGLEYIASLSMPPSGTLSDIDFTSHFSSLGAHVRLKETTARPIERVGKSTPVGRTDTGFGPKYAADLLESMWGTQSLLHEWQKSVHNSVLHDIFVTGMTPEESAKKMSENIAKTFDNYENIKRIIYPVGKVRTNEAERAAGLGKTKLGEVSEATQYRTQQKVEQAWGSNVIETRRNKPNVEVQDKPQIDLGEGVNPDTATISTDKMSTINSIIDRLVKEGKIDPRSIPEGYKGTVAKVAYVLKENYGFTPAEFKFIYQGLGNDVDELEFSVVHAGGTVKGVAVRSASPKGYKTLYFPTDVKGKPVKVAPTVLDKELDVGEAVRKGLTPGETTFEKNRTRYEPSEYTKRPVLKGKLKLEEPQKEVVQAAVPAGKFTPEISEGISQAAPGTQALLNARQAAEDLKLADERMIAAQSRVDAGPKDDPAALLELEKAKAEYEAAKNAAKSAGDATEPANEVPTGATHDDDPADFVNIQPYTEFTDEEKEAILGFIGMSYAKNSTKEVAQALHSFNAAMTSDLLTAQAKLVSDLSDVSIKYAARVKFMGIPFMNMVNPMNSTHAVAGMTALDMRTSRATKFYEDITNPYTGKRFGKSASMQFSRQSQYLEAGLERIRMSTVNAANMSRKEVIRNLDEWYSVALNTDFPSVPTLSKMKRKEKLRYIRDAIFKPTSKGVPDALKQFELADGSNPVKDIVDNFENGAQESFHKVYGNVEDKAKVRGDELKSYNRYMHEKYRLTDADIADIKKAMIDGRIDADLTPYSREWLQEVGQVVNINSKLHTTKLLSSNLGEFHYLMQDTKLKLQAGDALHNGVFRQFAFKMSPEMVKYHNEQLVPATIDAKGNLLRGKLVSVDEILDPGYQYRIRDYNVPTEFKGKKGKPGRENAPSEYYISEDIMPHIGTLFDYMEEIHKLNDTINVKRLDKILGYFKASVTIYNIPTYPIRNLISDVFMSAMDGVIDPTLYRDAADLLMGHSKAMKNMDARDYQEVLDKNFLRQEFTRATHDPATTMTHPSYETNFNLHLALAEGPVTINGSQVMESFHTAGLGQNRVSGDVAQSLAAARQSGTMKKAGKVHDLLRDSNEIREDWTRVAHYLHALKTEAPLGGTFEDVVRRATLRVKKYHFDYNDISLVDRRLLGRWLPFYKWMKNIIPFTLASVVTKPWAIKSEQAIQHTVANFMNDDERTDFVVPEWIDYDNAVQIGSFNEEGHDFGQWASMYLPLSDTMKNFLHPVFNPLVDASGGTPRNRFKEMGEGVMQVGGSMLNPAAKSIIQGMTNTEVWDSGPAPEKGDWIDALLPIIPGYAGADQLQSKLLKLGQNDSSTGKSSLAKDLEWLGVMNVHDNTEGAQLGELNQREDFYRGQLDARKAELMNKIQKQYPDTTPTQRKEIVDQFLKMTREADPQRL